MEEAQQSKKRRVNSAIFISTRIRLARNLAGKKFVNALSKLELLNVLDICESAFAGVRKFAGGRFYRVEEMSELNRNMLVEDRLASRELVENNQARGLYVSADNSCAAMVNEEDHLRIQTFAKGLNFNSTVRAANAIDDGFEKMIEYAFSPIFGYLTACPTNVGTGLRASVMMHLPALSLSELMEQIIRGLGQLGICVRGASGEGSDSFGSIYQISNQHTLGISEANIVKKIGKFVRKIAEFEINARNKLAWENPLLLDDKFNRAAAILASCKLIDTSEAVSQLSYLRLKADMSRSPEAENFISQIDDMIVKVQPSHLQTYFESYSADLQERDSLRAKLLNSFAASIPTL